MTHSSDLVERPSSSSSRTATEDCFRPELHRQELRHGHDRGVPVERTLDRLTVLRRRSLADELLRVPTDRIRDEHQDCADHDRRDRVPRTVVSRLDEREADERHDQHDVAKAKIVLGTAAAESQEPLCDGTIVSTLVAGLGL